MKMNEIYEAPQLELVKVCVEAGFETSPVRDDSGFGGGGGTPFPE